MSFEREEAFVEDADILGPGFEKEFDNIAEWLNALFEIGRVAASADTFLAPVSFADIAGAELDITVTRPSVLKIDAVVDVETTESGIGVGGAIVALNVDSVDRPELIELSSANAIRATVAQSYVVPLAVGAHVIKLRGKRAGGLTTKYHQASTGFTYLRIPEP